jgi:hypothetical protein
MLKLYFYHILCSSFKHGLTNPETARLTGEWSEGYNRWDD